MTQAYPCLRLFNATSRACLDANSCLGIIADVQGEELAGQAAGWPCAHEVARVRQCCKQLSKQALTWAAAFGTQSIASFAYALTIVGACKIKTHMRLAEGCHPNLTLKELLKAEGHLPAVHSSAQLPSVSSTRWHELHCFALGPKHVPHCLHACVSQQKHHETGTTAILYRSQVAHCLLLLGKVPSGQEATQSARLPVTRVYSRQPWHRSEPKPSQPSAQHNRQFQNAAVPSQTQRTAPLHW